MCFPKTCTYWTVRTYEWCGKLVFGVRSMLKLRHECQLFGGNLRLGSGEDRLRKRLKRHGLEYVHKTATSLDKAVGVSNPAATSGTALGVAYAKIKGWL